MNTTTNWSKFDNSTSVLFNLDGITKN